MNQYQPPSQPGPWGQQPQEGYNQPQQPSMQPQKKPRKPVSRRAQIGCVSAIALLVIIIFAAIAANGGGSNASPTTSNQSQVTATQPTSQPTQAPQSIGQQVDSIVQNAGLLGKAKTSYQSDGTVTVTDDIGDGNLTNSLTVGEIHLECFTAEKALWTSGIASKLSDVTVNITMNVVDQ